MRATLLGYFGNILIDRFNRRSDPADEETAVFAFHKLYNCTFSEPLDRLDAAKTLLLFFKRHKEWQNTATIAESAVKVLPSIHSSALSSLEVTMEKSL